MLAILSPAKTLDFDSPLTTDQHSAPEFTKESTALIKTLRQLEPSDIGSLMGISDKLATLGSVDMKLTRGVASRPSTRSFTLVHWYAGANWHRSGCGGVGGAAGGIANTSGVGVAGSGTRCSASRGGTDSSCSSARLLTSSCSDPLGTACIFT